MAKLPEIKKEEKKVETCEVSVQDSEKLQKEGWVVVAMLRKDGQRLHKLIKEE